MTFDKALQILGLNKNFTEEDLKRAHRNLAQVHHPDRHEKSEDREKEEDIMKDINAAKDYLMKYLKSTTPNNQTHSNTTHGNAYSINYIHKKLDELRNIVNTSFIKETLSVNLTKIIQEIQNLYREFSLKRTINIDALYNEYLNKIKNKFKELEIEFYKENYINKSDIKENINYDCTLKEFYEQLLKFRDKYSKETLLKKKLEEELLKYTYFAGYETIENQIKDIVRNFVNKIKNKGFKYNQKDIDDMHQEISNLFNEFFSLKKKIEDLEKIVQTVNDEKIKEQYELIKNNLYSGYPFNSFYKEISELEELIDKYQKENQIKSKFKENEQAINDIYKGLIERYSEVAQSFNIVTMGDTINNLNEFFNETLELFQTGCKQYKDLEFFNLFKEITFISFHNDDKITKKIRNDLKEKRSKIYIKINIGKIWDEYSFFWFDEENMIMYRIDNLDNVIYEKISYQQLDEDYITLEDFLDEANFVGEHKMKLNGTVVGLVYERLGHSLYREKDKFRIDKDITLLKISNRNDEYLNRFRDKKYVYDMIEEQLRESLEEYKKREHKKYEKYFEFKERYNDINKKIYDKKEYNYNDPYGYSGPKRTK